MSIAAILAPTFVLVALTFALMFWMGFSRLGSVKRGETKVPSIALGQQNWPPKVMQISNCYHNQFQLPVLFYVLTMLVMITRHADVLFLLLAWGFVITRLIHAYIHTGTNYVRYRFYAFLVGGIILLLMWAIFAARILLGLP